MWQERGKHSEKLEKWKLDDIHKFMDLLDMPRGSGDKKVGPLSVHAAGHHRVSSTLQDLWLTSGGPLRPAACRGECMQYVICGNHRCFHDE